MGMDVPSLSFNSGIGVEILAIVGMLHKVRGVAITLNE